MGQKHLSASVYAKKKALTPREVQELYGIKQQTLANWRCKGKGPAYVSLGRKILYLLCDLDDFILRHRVNTFVG